MVARPSARTFLIALLAAACSDQKVNAPPPLDRFYFPTGLAVRHVDAAGATSACTGGSPGCATQLVVASSNFDLRYDVTNGGTLAVVDVDAAIARSDPALPPPPLAAPVLRATRIGSFAGELALLDETTCPGWERSGGGPQALVPSRSQRTLYRVDLAQGDPACDLGGACPVPLSTTAADPYGVAVACGFFTEVAGGQLFQRFYAFTTYLRSQGSLGYVSRLDLQTGALVDRGVNTADLPSVPTHSLLFDPPSSRLFITGRFAGIGFTPLRWLTLAAPDPSALPSVMSFADTVRGGELRGIALSSDRRRAYLAFRVYDADEAARIGLRPAGDLAGALVVADFGDAALARPTGTVLNVVQLDRGVTEVRVLPRAGKRDLVAVTSSDDGTLTLYDDETATVARVVARCEPQDGVDALAPAPCEAGTPRLGKQPFGLAVEPRADGLARLYVGSFDRSWINVMEIDPARPEATTRLDGTRLGWWRIGPERR